MKSVRLTTIAEQRFSLTVVSLVFVLIAVIGYFFAYPDSPPEWKVSPFLRSMPILVFAAIIYFWLSTTQILAVDVVNRRLCILNYILFAIPYRRRKIDFTKVVSIACEQQPDEEFGRILRVYIVLQDQEIEIMRRFRKPEFNACLADARRIGKAISVPFNRQRR